MNTKQTLTAVILTLALMLGIGAVAQADCFIGGNIAVEANSDPAYPNWKYTAVISWDTGTVYALSHLGIILDTASGSCACSDLAEALIYEGIPGYSDGDPMGCEVEYETTLECEGDPSIPDVEGIIFKFEPISIDCEPGTTGTGTFVFYSNFGPAPIDEEILVLFDKFGLLSCFGYLTGMFPGLTCDPVLNKVESWDAMKGLFR